MSNYEGPATATEPVRCRGCKRRLGLGTGSHNGIYCSASCRDDIPATEFESRDSVVTLLAALGVPRVTLGAGLKLSKQRISQIITYRKEAL